MVARVYTILFVWEKGIVNTLRHVDGERKKGSFIMHNMITCQVAILYPVHE